MLVNQADIEQRLMDLDHRVDRMEQILPAVLTRDEFQIAMEKSGAGIDRHFAGIDQRFADVDRRFADVDRRFADLDRHFKVLRDELVARMDAGDEETRRQMRVLHQEVISRIALLNESLNGSARKPL